MDVRFNYLSVRYAVVSDVLSDLRWSSGFYLGGPPSSARPGWTSARSSSPPSVNAITGTPPSRRGLWWHHIGPHSADMPPAAAANLDTILVPADQHSTHYCECPMVAIGPESRALGPYSSPWSITMSLHVEMFVAFVACVGGGRAIGVPPSTGLPRLGASRTRVLGPVTSEWALPSL